MSDNRPCALVRVSWLDPATAHKWSQGEDFATTGYCERDGWDGVFSIVIKHVLNPPPGSEGELARVFALAPHLAERLPDVGERLIVSAGARPFGVLTVLDRGVAPFAKRR